MPRAPFENVLKYLFQACAMQGDCDLPDRELLERFRTQRDESAFMFLVRRHGPVIYGVCRRLLGDAHEAEDAFQATFLVLVRRIDLIRRKESIASWLYGVARRIASKARTRLAAQRALERRGISLTVAALATSLTDMASAAPLPVLLTIKTVNAATLMAAGSAVAGDSISAGVMALVDEAMAGMAWIKSKVVLLVLAMGTPCAAEQPGSVAAAAGETLNLENQ